MEVITCTFILSVVEMLNEYLFNPSSLKCTNAAKLLLILFFLHVEVFQLYRMGTRELLFLMECLTVSIKLTLFETNMWIPLQPGPRGALIQCFIKRNRSNQTYHLYLCLNQGKRCIY